MDRLSAEAALHNAADDDSDVDVEANRRPAFIKARSGDIPWHPEMALERWSRSLSAVLLQHLLYEVQVLPSQSRRAMLDLGLLVPDCAFMRACQHLLLRLVQSWWQNPNIILASQIVEGLEGGDRAAGELH